MEQRLVAGAAAQNEGDVGDEEGTPHDEEEEEDDSQDLRERGRKKTEKVKEERRIKEVNWEENRRGQKKSIILFMANSKCKINNWYKDRYSFTFSEN